MDPPAKRAGRPPGIFKLQPDDETLRRVKELSAHMLTQKEAAAVMGVAENTFNDFLRRYKKAREAWDMGASTGRASIRRQQFVHSKRHAGMSIWLGKIYLEQREQTQIGVGGIPGAPPVGITHSAGRGLDALLESARRENEKLEAARREKAIAPPQESSADLGTISADRGKGSPMPQANKMLDPSADPRKDDPEREPALATKDLTPQAEEPKRALAPPRGPAPEPPKKKAGPGPAKSPPPKAPSFPPGFQEFAASRAARITGEDSIETAGVARAVSDEAVMAEARRLGLRGQVSAHELNEIRKKLAGESYQPSYAEVCERAGATMRHRPLFPRH